MACGHSDPLLGVGLCFAIMATFLWLQRTAEGAGPGTPVSYVIPASTSHPRALAIMVADECFELSGLGTAGQVQTWVPDIVCFLAVLSVAAATWLAPRGMLGESGHQQHVSMSVMVSLVLGMPRP